MLKKNSFFQMLPLKLQNCKSAPQNILRSQSETSRGKTKANDQEKYTAT